jgi:Fe-S-cluster containining protein
MAGASVPEEVQVGFSLRTKEGSIDGVATVPTAQMTLTQLLPVLQRISSSIVDAVEEQVLSRGYSVSCKAGCAACCRQLVPISLFEAEAMGNWIRTLPEEQQAILQARFHRALRELLEKGMLERMDPAARAKLSEAENQQLLLDYLAQRVACPFLENELCSIHPIRPLACREYLVTSPPEHCANPTPETLKMIKIPVTLNIALVHKARTLPGETVGRLPLVFCSHG